MKDIIFPRPGPARSNGIRESTGRILAAIAERRRDDMRLWTLHPKYLDPQGLVALWREALLARAVLRGETKGYRHHSQLLRFRSHPATRSAINAYLRFVLLEADSRGYAFDATKIGPVRASVRIRTTTGQVMYEWRHLLRKLRVRSPTLHRRWRAVALPEPHPIFDIMPGAVEPWERGHGIS